MLNRWNIDCDKKTNQKSKQTKTNKNVPNSSKIYCD